MKRKHLLLVLVACCVLTGAVAGYLWYQSRFPPEPQSATDAATDPMFDDTKPNRGGVRADKFAALDTDRDGRLNLTEFTAGRAPAEAAKWFERRDADHDGFLSKQEFLPQSASPKAR